MKKRMKEMRQMRGKTKIKDMTMTISSFLADLFSLEKKNTKRNEQSERVVS